MCMDVRGAYAGVANAVPSQHKAVTNAKCKRLQALLTFIPFFKDQATFSRKIYRIHDIATQ